ncbi:hypothetical protein FHG64_17675 [Antarcticibacterium flavum]|uniref:Tetracycline regulation of excision, RteC n=1 Tax=Antarcticibacterium flavum TaxID=2058175 RepID=A0A5B7X7K7_9FLAO|nr:MULTISPECIES: RteC domain-containing protein [Antarcticibacterium]MCM4161494.1 hypothetical protein [Antarcticibacterium sp. W02-3]QCY71080.1 hypothetical protein FHG64_17675 [Antarcticibacterium flavum]
MEFIIAEEKLEKEILALKEVSTNKLVVYEGIIKYLRSVLNLYRTRIYQNEFRDSEEEIKFFKLHKQIPQSRLVYYLQLRTLENPFSYGKRVRKKLYRKKIEKINKFNLLHYDFCNYMELEQQHLDQFYFTRAYLNENEITAQKNFLVDPNFNTSHDLLLSQYRAYKMLLPKLVAEVEKSKHPKVKNTGITLKWTASKVALTELLYALQVNSAINNGRTELITIASFFEDHFEVKLDNIYKTYSEIKSRKGSRTKFLNELTWQLEQKMKGDDAL